METPPTNMRTFSISVPGIEQWVTSENVSAECSQGLLSNLPVSRETGVFEYSEGRLEALLGETKPVLHPNLNTSNYTHRMDAKCVQHPFTAWSIAAAVSMGGAVATSMIYKYGPEFSLSARGALIVAMLVFAGFATLSCFAATEAGKEQPRARSYSYLDTFVAENLHIKWKEYWQGMLIDGCTWKKLRQVAGRAKEFGFRLSQLRNPRLSTKKDGTPLSGVDIWNFMMYNNDAGFASITRLLWAVEAARRVVGKPLRMEIRAVPKNAEFFIKLAEALSGTKPKGLSLSDPYSQPLADLLDGAAFYAGLGNAVPTQAAALSSLLARYYFDHGEKNKASLMMLSMEYVLQGKWRSAFESNLSVLSKPVDENAVAEQRVLSAIHHLGIARLIEERVIDGYVHEVIPSAYAYAYSAARIFNALAYEVNDAPLHFQILTRRALDIMRVMAQNGPFVEFR